MRGFLDRAHGCHCGGQRGPARGSPPLAGADRILIDGISSFDGTLNEDVTEFQTNLEPDPCVNFMLR